jgi:hypothetical protein
VGSHMHCGSAFVLQKRNCSGVSLTQPMYTASHRGLCLRAGPCAAAAPCLCSALDCGSCCFALLTMQVWWYAHHPRQ